jgi:hypothetical protein
MPDASASVDDNSGARRRGMLDEYLELPACRRLEADLKVFEVVAEHFRNDFRMVWEHSSFFVLIEGAFLSVYAALADDGAGSVINALAVVGVGVTVLWWWVAISRMRAVDRWRAAMSEIDQRVDFLAVFVHVESTVRRGRLFDSTWIIAWLLPPLIIVSWLLLVLAQ